VHPVALLPTKSRAATAKLLINEVKRAFVNARKITLH